MPLYGTTPDPITGEGVDGTTSKETQVKVKDMNRHEGMVVDENKK